MLSLTLFGTFDGLKVRHLYTNREQAPGVLSIINRLVVLENRIVVFEPDLPPIVMIYRRNTHGGIVTWIGLYKYLPQPSGTRPGSYFGVGISLLNSAANGGLVFDYLDEITNRVSGLMPEGQEARLDVEQLSLARIDLREEHLSELERAERQIDGSRGLGHGENTVDCFFDTSAASDGVSFGSYLDDVQEARAFMPFTRVVLSRDGERFAAIVRKRISARRLTPDDVTRAESDGVPKQDHQNSASARNANLQGATPGRYAVAAPMTARPDHGVPPNLTNILRILDEKVSRISGYDFDAIAKQAKRSMVLSASNILISLLVLFVFMANLSGWLGAAPPGSVAEPSNAPATSAHSLTYPETAPAPLAANDQSKLDNEVEMLVTDLKKLLSNEPAAGKSRVLDIKSKLESILPK